MGTRWGLPRVTLPSLERQSLGVDGLGWEPSGYSPQKRRAPRGSLGGPIVAPGIADAQRTLAGRVGSAASGTRIAVVGSQTAASGRGAQSGANS